MKRISTLSLLFVLFSFVVIGAPKYWVGISNGNWSDRANWSDVSNGSSGAALPGAQDSVIFTANHVAAIVHVDLSLTIRALRIEGNEGFVTLYASTPVTFTLLGSLNIPPYRTLKDSTSADVPFNFIFSGATRSQSTIRGRWVFEGGVAVNRATGGGASFTAEPGSSVNFLSIGFAGFLNSGVLIFRNNTNYISSNPSSLKFSADTKYILENNLDGAVPDATWSDSLDAEGFPIVSASSIRIMGKMGKLSHSATAPRYKDVFVDLYDQSTSASLDLPDGTTIQGNLNILNTNKQPFTLLAATGPSSSVNVRLYGFNARGAAVAGILNISDNASVAMATATSASAATSYNLQLIDFNQSGGNFSLQDYNNAVGSSVLSVSGNLVQTAGSFVTNSNTTDARAKFIVEMNGPILSSIPCPCPKVGRGQFIRMNGNTIDNANHMVTLRLAHTQYSNPSYPDKEGVDLQTPLEVGRLELLKGTLNTTDENILTVTDPGQLSAVTIGTAGDSYVNGPLRRYTNSTGSYTFPTGRGKIVSSTHFDSCVIIPASPELSIYQAAYFDTGYTDLNVASPLKGISKTEYWKISRLSGAAARVQLVFNSPVAGAAPSDAVIAGRYINDHWVAVNGSVLTPGDSVSGSATSKQLTDFGPFTFAYADPGNLPQDTAAGSIGLNYKYYEGGFNTLPDFSTLTPVKSGNSQNVDLAVRRVNVNDSFAILWEGFINIPAAGTYTFETVSDDGSKFYFNSLYSYQANALVDNDGTHLAKSAFGTVTIPAAGRYPVAISFFENFGDQVIELYWSAPGLQRQRIPDIAFTTGAIALFTDLDSANRLNQRVIPSRPQKRIEIKKIYPNPFIEYFTLDFYNSSRANEVSVYVYDLSGKLIHVDHAGHLAAGNISRKISLAGKEIASGVYFAKLVINSVSSKTVKLFKVKN